VLSWARTQHAIVDTASTIASPASFPGGETFPSQAIIWILSLGRCEESSIGTLGGVPQSIVQQPVKVGRGDGKLTMVLRNRLSVLVVLLLASPAFAEVAPKELIIWGSGGFAGQYTYGLYLSDSDGKNERPLDAGKGPNYNPSFSADGRWIVFTSERHGSADIFRVHPDGSGLERLTDSSAFDDQGVLSPDGSTLAFVSSRGGGTANIWLLDVFSHRVRNLTRNKAGNFRPSWSPNGKWIAFSSDRDTPRSRYIFDTDPAWNLMQRTAVYIVHPDGTGLKRLTALDGCAARGVRPGG
jgi:Tol biopolymer transport system component